MDWKQEVFKRLDALSEKLGVAAGHLWAVLVRQAYAEAIADLVWCAVGITVFCVSLYWFRWAVKKGSTEEGKDYSGEVKSGVCGAGFASATAGVVSFIFTMGMLHEAIMTLINPEYYALQKIIEVFK